MSQATIRFHSARACAAARSGCRRAGLRRGSDRGSPPSAGIARPGSRCRRPPRRRAPRRSASVPPRNGRQRLVAAHPGAAAPRQHVPRPSHREMITLGLRQPFSGRSSGEPNGKHFVRFCFKLVLAGWLRPRWAARSGSAAADYQRGSSGPAIREAGAKHGGDAKTGSREARDRRRWWSRTRSSRPARRADRRAPTRHR